MGGEGGSRGPDEIARSERALRDEEARDYDRHVESDEWLARVNDTSVMRALDPKPGDTVLDAGCGTGRRLPELLRRASSVIGVDHSERSVEVALEKAPEADRDRLRLLVGDVRELPVEDGSADRVLSVGVVQHVPSPEYRKQALREMRRVLRPGGLALVHVYHWGGKVKRHRDGFWGNNLYRHAFTNGELRGLYAQAGFTDIRLQGLPVLPNLFPSSDSGLQLQWRLSRSLVGRRLGLYLMATGTAA